MTLRNAAIFVMAAAVVVALVAALLFFSSRPAQTVSASVTSPAPPDWFSMSCQQLAQAADAYANGPAYYASGSARGTINPWAQFLATIWAGESCGGR